MKSELEKIFGRNVDLITRKSVEKSSNYTRRESILSNLKSIYTE
jgi:predicted nucleotidyltransferase